MAFDEYGRERDYETWRAGREWRSGPGGEDYWGAEYGRGYPGREAWGGWGWRGGYGYGRGGWNEPGWRSEPYWRGGRYGPPGEGGRYGYGNPGWRGRDYFANEYRGWYGTPRWPGAAEPGEYHPGTSRWDRGYGSEYGRGELGRGSLAGRGPRGYRRSDERIEEDVNERLTRHPGIDATDIEVRVNHGEVTLTGTVRDRQAKRMAEDAAEAVSGVIDVHNQLRVSAGGAEREVARPAAREGTSGERTRSTTRSRART